MHLSSLPASAAHSCGANTGSASRSFAGVPRAALTLHPSAIRHNGLLGKNAELQKLSVGCRVRRQASALAQSTGQEVALPEGYVWYETMIVLRPDMNEEERDVELAKFEAFLKKEDAREISALVRGSQHLAYPIKGYWDGIYVLYTYAAQRKTSQNVQKLLSTPIVGSEKNVLRHMTFIN